MKKLLKSGSRHTEQSKVSLYSNDLKKYVAFTLAEVIVVLTLLGTVAAITIPSALKSSTDKQNVVRVKKALPIFEKVVEQMRITNNLTSVDALKDYANNDNNCTNIRKEFKIKKDGDNNCQFQTYDGVWWDLSDITKPIISPLKDGNNYLSSTYANKSLSDTDGKKAFYLTLTQGDASQGYAFLVNEPDGDACNTLKYAKIISEDEMCNAKSCSGSTCIIDDIEYKLIDLDTNHIINLMFTCIVDGEPKYPCESKVASSQLYFSQVIPNEKILAIEEGEYFWDKAEIYCKKNGGRLPSAAELETSGQCNKARCWGAEVDSNSNLAVVVSRGHVDYNERITKFSYGGMSIICVKEP